MIPGALTNKPPILIFALESVSWGSNLWQWFMHLSLSFFINPQIKSNICCLILWNILQLLYATVANSAFIFITFYVVFITFIFATANQKINTSQKMDTIGIWKFVSKNLWNSCIWEEGSDKLACFFSFLSGSLLKSSL